MDHSTAKLSFGNAPEMFQHVLGRWSRTFRALRSPTAPSPDLTESVGLRSRGAALVLCKQCAVGE
jgi:hypothetical protein